MKKGDVIGEGDGETQRIFQDKVRSKKGKKREEQGESGKEIDTQEGPEREKKGDGVEGLEQGA
jgi:hypothetical protein